MLDLLFLHPPSVYDFRKKIMITGPLASLTPEYTYAFVSFPVGLMSMAGYLKKTGYNVKIANLGARMVSSKFDVEEFLKNQKSRIFGIDLHWCVHSQGAIEIARICKKLHPDSLVVLGGLTATRFDVEIIEAYPHVDAVIKGEGEQPILKLVEKLEKGSDFSDIQNLTYRDRDGHIKRNSLHKVVEDLDSFDFADLDVLYSEDLSLIKKIGRWCLPVCRGCLYNCVTCGGSMYSYRTLMNREKPAFRSPSKILEDIHTLAEYGITRIFLFGDIRMGGKAYQEELLRLLKRERPVYENLTMELFQPADENFIRSLSSLSRNLYITISPESGVESVRKAHGRNYSNQELLDTIKLCAKYQIKLGVFFMLSLAQENEQTVAETVKLCSEAIKYKTFSIPLISWGCMLLLDPGSLAFDSPSEYGYKLLSKTFREYYNALLSPSWKYYLTYETDSLSREKIVELFFTALDQLASLLSKDLTMRHMERKHLDIIIENFMLDEIDSILKLDSEKERNNRLEKLVEATGMYYQHVAKTGNMELKNLISSLAGKFAHPLFDHYGYKKHIRQILASELAASHIKK